MTEREPPYSEPISYVDDVDYFLTHVIWHSSSMLGGPYAQPETGVRRKEGGVVVPGSFELIQHGWRDFDAATKVILRGLYKGWDTYRIGTLMDWMRERRRNPPRLSQTHTGDTDG